MVGLIAEDGTQIVGIIARQTLRQHARQMKSSGERSITQLAGVSLTRASYFVCPKEDYRKLIIRYDPDNPPLCPTHGLFLNKKA